MSKNKQYDLPKFQQLHDAIIKVQTRVKLFICAKEFV